MNKKEILLCGFLFLIFSAFIVRAQSGIGSQVTGVVQSTINAATSIGQPVFSALIGNYDTSEFLFTKFLLAVLLYVIIFSVLKKTAIFGDNKGIKIIISLVVSIMAIRFMSENDLVKGVLLPYGTLGVALTTILPFLIFFYFLHDSKIGSFGRRAAWFLFGAIFMVLWSSRFSELSSLSNQIYGWTLVGMVIAFIADSGIHKYFGYYEFKKYETNVNNLTRARAQKLIRDFSDVDTREAREVVAAAKLRLQRSD